MDNQYPEFSILMDAAITIHEMFQSLLSAGFTERQALTIVIGILKNGQS